MRGRLRNWRMWMLAAAIVALFLGTAFAFKQRGEDLNIRDSRLAWIAYQLCVENEVQDEQIVIQLRAAKRRALASLPPRSAELYYQLQILDDGIAALEPPDETECQPPRGTDP